MAWIARCRQVAKKCIVPLAIWSPIRYNKLVLAAGVAQLVEHLICNQRVGGSNPFASSSLSAYSRGNGRRALVEVSGVGFNKSGTCSALRGHGGVPASNRRLELLGSNQRDPNTERKGVLVLASAR